MFVYVHAWDLRTHVAMDNDRTDRVCELACLAAQLRQATNRAMQCNRKKHYAITHVQIFGHS